MGTVLPLYLTPDEIEQARGRVADRCLGAFNRVPDRLAEADVLAVLKELQATLAELNETLRHLRLMAERTNAFIERASNKVN